MIVSEQAKEFQEDKGIVVYHKNWFQTISPFNND